MKAIILAGGLGTRLRPLTLSVPKPLIPIQGKTLTEHVIDIFKNVGVADFILSIGYHADKIQEYFENGKRFGVNIEYVTEENPLGTAGPLIVLNRENRALHETFYMVNGDNLFNINLEEMLKVHKKNCAAATIGLTAVKDVSAYGVAEVEKLENGMLIKHFVEKPEPKDAPSNFINSGYYICEPEVFEILKGKDRAMMEKDVFPTLAEEKKLFGYYDDSQWFDTGTPDRYERVQRSWKRREPKSRDVQIKAKPWGREIWFAHTDEYAGKILEVKKGHRLSLQYHEYKTETLYLVSGKAKFTFGKSQDELSERIFNPGDKIDIHPYTVHRVEALEDTQIFEVSTPHLTDIVKLEDDYGRSGKGNNEAKDRELWLKLQRQ